MGKHLHTRYVVGAMALGGLLALSGAATSTRSAVAADERPATGMLTGPSLIQALQRGGHVIYIRHAATDRTQADTDRSNLENCQTQRNLSAEGQRQSREIGLAFRRLGIRVGKVVASPFCRALDTARLAFGSADKSNSLYFAVGASAEDRARQSADLRALLSTAPPPGVNTVLVSHHANLKEAAGVWPKKEGDAKVFRPRPDGGFDMVGEASAEDWSRWAQALAGR